MDYRNRFGVKQSGASNINKNVTAADLADINRGGKKSASALPDGEHVLTITGTDLHKTNNGGIVVVVQAEDTGGQPVRLRAMLVKSPGGQSDMILRNLEALELLADCDDTYSLAEIIETLNAGRLVTVELMLAVDRTGQQCNAIVAILSTDALNQE